MHVAEHVWRTENGRYVPPGDPEAAYLAFAPGQEIVDAEARRIGLTDYLKSRSAPLDKAIARPMDKGVMAPGKK